MHHVSTPVRSIALWLLALFSGALALLGMWVILDRLPGMEAVLDDGTATPTQVYGGQSWVVVGAAVLAAGLIGLTSTLAVAARSARPAAVAADPGVGVEGTADASDSLVTADAEPAHAVTPTVDESPEDTELPIADDEAVPTSR